MKSWHKSFTIWFNVVMGSVQALLLLLAQDLPAMKVYLPNNLYAWLFVLVTVGNILIRVYRTKTALSLLPPLVK